MSSTCMKSAMGPLAGTSDRLGSCASSTTSSDCAVPRSPSRPCTVERLPATVVSAPLTVASAPLMLPASVLTSPRSVALLPCRLVTVFTRPLSALPLAKRVRSVVCRPSMLV